MGWFLDDLLGEAPWVIRGTFRLWARELCEGRVDRRLGGSQLGDRKSSDGGRALAVAVGDSVGGGHSVE